MTDTEIVQHLTEMRGKFSRLSDAYYIRRASQQDGELGKLCQDCAVALDWAIERLGGLDRLNK